MKKKFFPFLLITLIIILGSQITKAEQNDNVSEHQLLRQLFTSGQQLQAIEQAKQYLKQYPKDGYIRLVLGQFYFQQKKYDLAREQFTLALEETPNYTDVRIALINLDIEIHDFDNATLLIKQGLILSPQNKDLLTAKKSLDTIKNSSVVTKGITTPTVPEFKRLQQLFASGKQQQAITQAKQYLLQVPKDSNVRLVLGQFYFQQKNYDLAREQFTLALEQTPNYTDVRIALINLDIATHDFDNASLLIKQGLILSPQNKELLAAKKSVDAMKNPTVVTKEITAPAVSVPKLTKPVEVVEKNTTEVTKKTTKPAVPEFKRLRQLFASGKQQQAITQAKQYLHQFPKDGDVRLVLGQFYFQQKSYDLAREQFTLALEETPNYTDVRIALINLNMATHDFDNASLLIKQGLILSPQNKKLLAAKKSVDAMKNPTVVTKEITAPAVSVPKLTKPVEVVEKNTTEVTKKTTKPAVPEFKRLRQLFASGKQQQAITQAKQYLHQFPKDGDVRLVLGQFYFQQKSYDLAREQFTLALEETPNYTDVRIALINLNMATHDFDNASLLIKQGLILSPQNKELLAAKKSVDTIQEPILTSNKNDTEKASSDIPEYKLLQQLYASGKQQQAIAQAKVYLKQYPKDGDVRLVLGQFYFQQKRYDLAREQFTLALEETPNYTDVRIALINLNMATRDFDNASLLIKQGLILSPQNKDLLTAKKSLDTTKNLSLTTKENPTEYQILQKMYASRKHKQVIERSKNYLAKHPEDGDVRLILGLEYLNAKNYKKATVEFETILAQYPKYVDARVYLIDIKIHDGHISQALITVDNGLKLTPDNPYLLNKKARIFVAEHQYNKALQYAKKAILNSKSKDAQSSAKETLKFIISLKNGKNEIAKKNTPVKSAYDIANNYLKEGKFFDAKVYAINYLNKNPKDADVRLVLGQVYLKEKNYRQAETEFEFILTYYPKYIDARVFLVDVEIALGDTTRAFVMLEQGLTFTPNNPYLINAKAKIFLAQYQYGQAAYLAKKSILKSKTKEEQKAGQETIKEIKEINPFIVWGRNEIGIGSQNDYIVDLKTGWDYSAVYYSRDTSLGRVALSENYNSRFGHGSAQTIVNFSPVFNKYFYIEMTAAYARDRVLFPNYLIGGEAFVAIPNFLGVSFGGRYANIGPTFYTFTTGSISKDIGKFWISFRPYYFQTKHGPQSILYTGTIKRYLGTLDRSISLTIGAGYSPDLSDLQTINFFSIKNNYLTLNFEFPIFDHRILVDLGGDYQRWHYPRVISNEGVAIIANPFDRRLEGGTLGFKYRF
jgi:YaiO family outer membrane protein